jgi:hypothetical protein
MITREGVDRIAEKWAAAFFRSGLTRQPSPERTTGNA